MRPLLLLAILCLAACGDPRPAAAVRIERDVPYAGTSPAQRLDLYLPAGAGPHPLIISIHGGAFRFGDKADGQVEPMLAGLERGFAVASINYRLSGEARFPAQIQDVKAAIRFLRAHAAEYGVDPHRFAVWGGSAGGHLACLAGTTGGVRVWDVPDMPHAALDDRVQAVVAWFPPLDFASMDAQLRASGSGTPDHDAADSPESRLLGGPVPTVTELARQAAPATWLTTDDPAFLLQHGTADALVPVQQSQVFTNQARAILGTAAVTFETLPGAGHGDRAFTTAANVAQVLDHLERVLGPP